MDELKKCFKCKKKRSLGDFFKKKSSPDGLTARCKFCIAKERKKYYQKNRQEIIDKVKNNPKIKRYRRRWQIKNAYGITYQEYKSMWLKQHGRCAICGIKKKRLLIDHCHDVNYVRGLLCSKCNMGLGLFGDVLNNLKRAVKYLERSKWMGIERPKLWEHADYCLRASLWSIGQWWKIDKPDNKIAAEARPKMAMKLMKEECRLNKWLGHRKSSEYRWSKDVHGGKLSIRSFIQKYILKHLGIDPYCGLNGDQYRAYFTWLAIQRDFLGALKVEFGFMFRSLFIVILFNILYCALTTIGILPFTLWPFIAIYPLSYIIGIYPSMTDFTIHKPQARMLQWKVLAKYIPIYWLPYCIARLVFNWRCSRQIKGGFKLGTTNKITMLPTMLVLGMKMPDEAFINKTYDIYWKPGSKGYFIGESIREGIKHEQERLNK